MQRKGDGDPRDRSTWSYARLLEWFILQNTRPEPVAPEIRWTYKTFAEAIDVDDRYLRYWRHGHVLPSERSREAIERALFGSNRAHDQNRSALRAAYDREKSRGKRDEGPADAGANALGARITIRDGDPQGPILFQQSTALVRIGRDPTSDIVIADATASWEHGHILLASSVYVYRHLGRNATTLVRKDGESLELARGQNAEIILRIFDSLVISTRSLNIHFQLPQDRDYSPTVRIQPSSRDRR